MDTLKKTFYVSSQKLEGQAGLALEQFLLGFYIGSFGDVFKIGAAKEALGISFERVSTETDALLENNFITIKEKELVISGSDMNTQLIYYISIPEKNIFVVFNDLFIAKNLLIGLGLEVEYDAEARGGDLTFFKYVNRLKFGEIIEVSYQDNNLQVKKSLQADILLQPSYPMTVEEAKVRFYDTLLSVTKKYTDNEEELCMSLSGGVDSGTIAYMLKQLNKKVMAFTLGTDWGNEYKEAQETADYLDIPLIKIHISKEEILHEMPNVIRYFAFTDITQIEIALVGCCLYRKLNQQFGKDLTFVTGYGSDLLNAGIYAPFNHYSELEKQILNNLRKTQVSNEFNNLFANNLGIKTLHPFWHSDVIKEALRIPVEYKVKEGKDKYFFRSLMEDRIPASIAWRTKKGAHQGTGLSSYLKEAIENLPNVNKTNSCDSKEILKNIHKDIFFNQKYPW